MPLIPLSRASPSLLPHHGVGGDRQALEVGVQKSLVQACPGTNSRTPDKLIAFLANALGGKQSAPAFLLDNYKVTNLFENNCRNALFI